MRGYFNPWFRAHADTIREVIQKQRKSDEEFYKVDHVPHTAVQIDYAPTRIMLSDAYRTGFSTIGFYFGTWYKFN